MAAISIQTPTTARINLIYAEPHRNKFIWIPIGNTKLATATIYHRYCSGWDDISLMLRGFDQRDNYRGCSLSRNFVTQDRHATLSRNIVTQDQHPTSTLNIVTQDRYARSSPNIVTQHRQIPLRASLLCSSCNDCDQDTW